MAKKKRIEGNFYANCANFHELEKRDHNMRRFIPFLLTAVLFSGCVSHRSCQVSFNPGYTVVEVKKDWYGVIPGICGFTDHVCYDYLFRLHGEKSDYGSSEIEKVEAEPHSAPYDGTISISRNHRRVVVKLSRNGYPFDLNGTYHYRAAE